MAIQLLLRADDLGYSEAVNYGIEKTVKHGIIRSVGLMPNMPAAAHGVRLLQDTNICLGQHTNLCVGSPCADPAYIPSLLDGSGELMSSRSYREAWRCGKEIVVLEEAIIEVEAQYQRFKELTGHEPCYFEAHAVQSLNVSKALRIVAQRHQLKLNDRASDGATHTFNRKLISYCPMKSMEKDYDPWQSLWQGVLNARKDIPNIFVCHPGYLDYYLMQHSSLTINRTKEVEMLTDPTLPDWLKEQGVELITYNDI